MTACGRPCHLDHAAASSQQPNPCIRGRGPPCRIRTPHRASMSSTNRCSPPEGIWTTRTSSPMSLSLLGVHVLLFGFYSTCERNEVMWLTASSHPVAALQDTTKFDRSWYRTRVSAVNLQPRSARKSVISNSTAESCAAISRHMQAAMTTVDNVQPKCLR